MQSFLDISQKSDMKETKQAKATKASQSIGRQLLRKLSVSSASVLSYVPDSMSLFWTKTIPYLFDTPYAKRTRFQHWLYYAMVTPLTNVTPFSLLYQCYLNEIFHTTGFTQLNHFVFMTLGLSWFIVWFYSQGLDLIFVLCLFTWYFFWGFLQRLKTFGLAMIPPLSLIYFIAVFVFHPLHEFTGIHPVFFVSFCAISLSVGHTTEPKIPPRVAAAKEWKSHRQFAQDHGYLISSILIFYTFIMGGFNEFLAIPRLFPILWLKVYCRFGFYRQFYEKLQSVVKPALSSGNPALDFIGVGGDITISEMFKRRTSQLGVHPQTAANDNLAKLE